jgi:Putative prokaryotic signal transducing protein
MHGFLLPLALLLVICDLINMEELIRTNDVVLLSFAESLLRDAGLRAFIADSHMSILEGSAGFIMRRLLVDAEDFEEAANLMRDAGLGHELRQP